MKSLLLIRHAKSSQAEYAQTDFERPLNERGLKDASAMAFRLFKKNIIIDAFVTSNANRALTTAIFFAKIYRVKEENIIQVPELYHANIETFYKIITRLNDDFKTVAVFSHNPGITYFANQLTATQIDHLPTCGVFAMNAKIDEWKNFKSSKKEFWFFDCPKLS